MLKTKSVENGEQIAIGMGMIRSFLSNYRNLRELFSIAVGPFSVVYVGGRYETFRPKVTEACGWIRTASGKLETN